MSVRQDSDGKYVTSDQPFAPHDHKWQADNADRWHQGYLDSTSSKPQSQPLASTVPSASNGEGDAVIGAALGYLMLTCLVWAVIFGLIFIPGLNSAGMLVSQGGIIAVPGGIIWFVLKTAYSIITAPMMVASAFDPYDPGTHLVWQAIMMTVMTLIIYKFRRKVTKPILYLLGFLALLAYISVGLVALNDNLWSAFKMFPYL